MAVIARDTFARDHLVYAWPLPIGPEGCEVSCGEDEQVVMCPAWMVGDRLGPGRHHWRTPDPTRPVSAFFVSTLPVDATFDMTTAFMIPNTGQPVRLRATGSLQVRCADPGLLIAQFVGLPFDAVNEGVLRSVSRSIERMLARLLTRRVVMAGTPAAVTDPSMLPSIVEELVAYNPTAGAVFGIELISMVHMVIGADDGSTPFVMLPSVPAPGGTWREPSDHVHTNGNGAMVPMAAASQPEISMTETAPGKRTKASTLSGPHASGEILTGVTSGEIGGGGHEAKTQRHASVPPADVVDAGVRDSATSSTLAGEIVARPQPPLPAPPLMPHGSQPPIEMPRSVDEITQPGVPTPVPGSLTLRGMPTAEPPKEVAVDAKEPPAPKARSSSPSIPPPIPAAAIRHTPPPQPVVPPPAVSSTISGLGTPPKATPTAPPARPAAKEPPSPEEARGSIIGIGMTAIGSTAVAGEIPTKVPPGGRVLVPGPNGLMQSATVRQLLQGYYELEVGSSGETIWVPVNGVVPE